VCKTIIASAIIRPIASHFLSVVYFWALHKNNVYMYFLNAVYRIIARTEHQDNAAAIQSACIEDVCFIRGTRPLKYFAQNPLDTFHGFTVSVTWQLVADLLATRQLHVPWHVKVSVTSQKSWQQVVVMKFGKRHDITDTTDFCQRQSIMDLSWTCCGEKAKIHFTSFPVASP